LFDKTVHRQQKKECVSTLYRQREERTDVQVGCVFLQFFSEHIILMLLCQSFTAVPQSLEYTF